MLRVQRLALGELLRLLRGLRGEGIEHRLRLVQLERDELELLLGDLDLDGEGIGLVLRVRLARGEVADARVGLADRGLVLRRGLLVALDVRARYLDGTLEILLAAERLLERIVGERLRLHREHDEGRRQYGYQQAPAAPRSTTSPVRPGSSHTPPILRHPGGRSQERSHFVAPGSIWQGASAPRASRRRRRQGARSRGRWRRAGS